MTTPILPPHPEPEPPAPQTPSAPKRAWWIKLLLGCAAVFGTFAVLLALLLWYALVVASPHIPSLEALTNYQPDVPMRIYTADHVLIGEYGAQRRDVAHLQDVPVALRQAVIAIEDARYYDHGGVDMMGVIRAAYVALTNGHASQGASTITMQVARNFFLSSEKTYTRKIYEMLLAYKIERALTKDQILEIYMNQIYLGERAYGFASAAHIYFDKDLKDLSLAECAMLAGLPKAPSAYNPVVNPKRAKVRQEYILERMFELGDITRDQYEAAVKQPIILKSPSHTYAVHAEYVAEMVRQMMLAQYKDSAYTRGLVVTTTIRSADQTLAYDALRRGITQYDTRHGYRGPEGHIKLPDAPEERGDAIAQALANHPNEGGLIAAVVTDVTPRAVQVAFADGTGATLNGDGLRFALNALSANAPASTRIRAGSIVRVMQNDRGAWAITQVPQIEGGFIAITPQDGSIRALVGGFDFNKNRFNHVTQAWRQPGSSFKPFIYSASLDKGLGPATIINDAPMYVTAGDGSTWAPKNYGGGFDGPMTMRTALKRSRNLVSVRILSHIGPKYAQQYITRFGFDADRHPAYLPMALGAGLVTPLQMAAAYSVFANGGYRVNPYLIAEVTDTSGRVLARAQPIVAEVNAPRAIDARNAYVMDSLLKSVAQGGTGARSNVLGRNDLGGKTGTTNDSRDAWFAGYQHNLAAIAWLGYDNPRSLGDKETGGGLALPIWIDFMGPSLKGVPPYHMARPDDVIYLGDEMYFKDFTPEHGFVSTLGISAAALAATAGSEAGGTEVPSAGAALNAEPAMPAPEPAGQISTQERQEMLNLFRGH